MNITISKVNPLIFSCVEVHAHDYDNRDDRDSKIHNVRIYQAQENHKNVKSNKPIDSNFRYFYIA